MSDVTKVLLFSGAGLSYPLGLPMTDGFKDIIESGDNRILNVLRSHLGSKFGDIEAILSSIEELNSNNNLIFNYISAMSPMDSHFGQVKNSIDRLRDSSKLYTSNLKKSVHEKLRTLDISQCESLYFNILKEIKTVIPKSAISFFTANYDLTFEDSIDNDDTIEKLKTYLHINEIEYGFSQRSIFDPTREYNWNPSILEYKKIHGSLGWITDTRGRITKSHAANTPDNPDSVPILYPGFKGSPQDEPFLSLHRQFLDRLLSADYTIFMGFAFRDPYINSLVNMALEINNNLKIFCYNPSAIDQLPSESHIPQLIKNKRFRHIKRKVEVIENPLKLSTEIKPAAVLEKI